MSKWKLFTTNTLAHNHSIRFCVNDFADNGKKLLLLINKILICTIKKFIGIVLKLPKSLFVARSRSHSIQQPFYRFTYMKLWNMSYKICDVMWIVFTFSSCSWFARAKMWSVLSLHLAKKPSEKSFSCYSFFLFVDILRSYINISLDFPFQTT